jgi:NAD(P)H-hydrate epimerase
MKVLSAAEMAVADRATVERGFAEESFALMEAAGGRVAEFVRAEFPAARRVLVVCGKGNNGGDGLVAARHLEQTGLAVTVVLLGRADELKGDAARAWAKLIAKAKCEIHQVSEAEGLSAALVAAKADLIIDALVGTGYSGELRGLAVDAVEWVKASGLPVVAVDVPSGWAADSKDAKAGGVVMPADAVVTFTAPKPAHVFGALTRKWSDAVVVAEIGTPHELHQSELKLGWAGDAVRLLDAPRARDANKGSFGHVLVVGGAIGRSGAAALASLAALRSGAGLVTAAVPKSVQPLVAGAAHELMTMALAETDEGALAAENQARLAEILERKTVIAVGPGMGTHPATRWFLEELLKASKVPLVLDADALNLMATMLGEDKGALRRVARGRTVVVTPHPGEMARLTGKSVAVIQQNRLEAAREFAAAHGVIVVLKGARTIIAAPDGQALVNTSGNPAMAKGGSGDLLTGLVAGLLAQFGDKPIEAVALGVWLHGLAADLLAAQCDERTILASDLLHVLSQAFLYRPDGGSGYLWIQGHRRN